MSQPFHSIPTRYSGVQFRSRLEARWAAFFDLIGWKWEYEPIDISGWIPDFILGDPSTRGILVEVKPFRLTDELLAIETRSEIGNKAFKAGDFRDLLLLGTGPLLSSSTRNDWSWCGVGLTSLRDEDVSCVNPVCESNKDCQVPDVYGCDHCVATPSAKISWDAAEIVACYIDNKGEWYKTRPSAPHREHAAIIPATGIWTDMITGEGLGNCWSIFEPSRVLDMWNEAGALTQWRGRGARP